MNQLVAITAPRIPELVAAAGERAGMRFLEFFAGNIRNPHTRRAYARAAEVIPGLVRERDRGSPRSAERHQRRTARDVPTPLLCRSSMISRITFCSAQPAMIRAARFGPIPVTSRRRQAPAG